METPTLATQVAKRIAYIHMMEGCGPTPGSPKHAKNVRQVVEGIISFLEQVKKIGVEENMQIHEVLGGPLGKDDVTSIMAVPHRKISLSIASGDGGKQVLKHSDEYLTQRLWGLFQHPSPELMQTKLMAAASHPHALGVYRVEERLFGYATAVATHAEQFNTDNLLADVRRLKDLLASIGPPRINGPTDYPETPQEFRELYPDLYNMVFSEEPRVPSQWTPHTRAMVQGLCPCRSSKKGCTLPCARTNIRGAPVHRASSFSALLNQACDMAGGGNISLLGFMWVSQSGENQTMVKHQQEKEVQQDSPVSLALMCPSPSKAPSLGSRTELPALEGLLARPALEWDPQNPQQDQHARQKQPQQPHQPGGPTTDVTKSPNMLSASMILCGVKAPSMSEATSKIRATLQGTVEVADKQAVVDANGGDDVHTTQVPIAADLAAGEKTNLKRPVAAVPAAGGKQSTA